MYGRTHNLANRLCVVNTNWRHLSNGIPYIVCWYRITLSLLGGDLRFYPAVITRAVFICHGRAGPVLGLTLFNASLIMGQLLRSGPSLMGGEFSLKQ